MAVAHVVTARANGLITSQRGDCRSSRTYCLAHHDIRRAGNVKLVQSLARSKQDFNNALGLLVPRKRSGQCAKCTARSQRSRRRLVASYAKATRAQDISAVTSLVRLVVAFSIAIFIWAGGVPAVLSARWAVNATTTRNDPASPIESIVAVASIQRAGDFHA